MGDYIYDVVISGAGPVGLNVAYNLKKSGLNVGVFEEHPQVGVPANCSGLISKNSMDSLNVDIDEAIVNRIRGAKLFSPNNQEIVIDIGKDFVAYLVDRTKFDRVFEKRAKKIGVSILNNTRLMNVRNESIFVEREKRGELLKGKFVIGSDGVNSTVRHLMDIKVNKNFFVHSMQTRVQGNFDPSFVELHFGNFARGFFAWVIPESKEHARVGLGCSLGLNIDNCFNEFMLKRFPEVKVFSKKSFLIPCGPPLKQWYNIQKKMLLLGDAGFFTKATTGGGLMLGLETSNLVSPLFNTLFSDKKFDFKEFDRVVAPINKELLLHWKLRSYYNNLSDDKIDKLFFKAKKANIENFLVEHGDMDRPSLFVGKLARNPKYWFLGKEVFSFLRV